MPCCQGTCEYIGEKKVKAAQGNSSPFFFIAVNFDKGSSVPPFPPSFGFFAGLCAKFHYSSSPWYCHETRLVCSPKKSQVFMEIVFISITTPFVTSDVKGGEGLRLESDPTNKASTEKDHDLPNPASQKPALPAGQKPSKNTSVTSLVAPMPPQTRATTHSAQPLS